MPVSTGKWTSMNQKVKSCHTRYQEPRSFLKLGAKKMHHVTVPIAELKAVEAS